MRAITQSPARAPCRSCGATAQRSCRRRSAALTQALRPCTSTVPRNAVTPRCSTSSTTPDQPSLASCEPVTVHDTAHVRRGREYALLEAFHAQEAVAGTIGADHARDERPGPNTF